MNLLTIEHLYTSGHGVEQSLGIGFVLGFSNGIIEQSGMYSMNYTCVEKRM